MKLRYIAALVVVGVLFHCTYLASKQSSPTKLDYDDGIWLLQYMKSQISQRLIITAIGNDPEIKVHCDASHNFYPDGKGHLGICIFIGMCKGAIYNRSNKLKPVTRSSCDSEILAMSSATLIGDFYRMFLEEITIWSYVVYYQDNNSGSNLMNRGIQENVTKKKYMTIHINDIYEYIDEKAHRARIERLDTSKMVSDIHTKPLKGKRYSEFNRMLLGHY